MIKKLLKNKDYASLLKFPDLKDRLNKVDRLGWTFVHSAVMDGDLNDLSFLLSNGSNPDAQDRSGVTPLFLACSKKNLRASQLLIKGGAKVDICDSHGNSPLWRVIFDYSEGDDIALVELLRAAGANPELNNNYGNSPRMMAKTIDKHPLRLYFDDWT